MLQQWARSNALLAFDFDGTLAPICAARDAAAMRPRTSALLMEACAFFPCAVISGRSLADVRSRLPSHPSLRVIGNHGIEPSDHETSCAAWVARAVPALRAALTAVAGADVEDKHHSISVHYRFAASKQTVMRALDRVLPTLDPPPRVVPGKLVINLIPPFAPNKGTAFESLLRETSVGRAIYVGDDDTDEDVFTREWPGSVMTIRVGRNSRSAALYSIRGQQNIDDLLRILVDARAGLENSSTTTPAE